MNEQPTSQRPSSRRESPESVGWGTWSGRSADRPANPSLERYTDLEVEARRRHRHPRWKIALACVVTVVVLLFGGTFLSIYWQARHNDAHPADAIVVMGAAQWNGRVSPVLEARLTHALALYTQGLAPTIIVTGGSVSGDIFTEGEVGQAWLEQRGVPRGDILVEKDSRGTVEQMQNVAKIAEANRIESVLIVSDGFHLFRSERLAAANGLTAYGSAAPDDSIPPQSSTELRYMLRETVAVIVQAPDWLF